MRMLRLFGCLQKFVHDPSQQIRLRFGGEFSAEQFVGPLDRKAKSQNLSVLCRCIHFKPLSSESMSYLRCIINC